MSIQDKHNPALVHEWIQMRPRAWHHLDELFAGMYYNRICAYIKLVIAAFYPDPHALHISFMLRFLIFSSFLPTRLRVALHRVPLLAQVLVTE